MSDSRHPLALRIKPEILEQIDMRAKAADLSRTEYMVKASLGEITNPTDADSRLASVEKRVERLERLAELSG